jgi:transposase InsO family protein
LNFFIRKKFEVFDMFKEFKALVENQTEKQIKVLRTDNGGEFCGNEFEEFIKKCGIERQKTTPYTPQQNGVAERMNRTLMEKSKVHAQCCRDRARILGRGSGYCMLSGQQITLISVG